jgi:hypothetical protein
LLPEVGNEFTQGFSPYAMAQNVESQTCRAFEAAVETLDFRSQIDRFPIGPNAARSC